MGLNQQFLRKAPLKQRDPLPCLVVAELDKLLLRQEDNVQTCILGQLLWCFHAASRWSHSMRSQSLRLEKIKRHCLGNRRSAAGVQDLSDKRSSAQTRLLPYVAIGTGLGGLLLGRTVAGRKS